MGVKSQVRYEQLPEKHSLPAEDVRTFKKGGAELLKGRKKKAARREHYKRQGDVQDRRVRKRQAGRQRDTHREMEGGGGRET